MTLLPLEIADILEKEYFAYVCTISGRNQPHITPMFFIFDSESGEIYLLASSKSKKIRNLMKDPKVSLTIDVRDPVNPFNNIGVMIHGFSIIGDSPAGSDSANRLYCQFEAKYGDQDMNRIGLDEKRVILKIVPKHIAHWKGSKFATVTC